MSRAGAIGLLLLNCMAAMFCATALCQGIPLASNRTSYERELEAVWSKTDEAARGKKLAELDAWLRRLPGRYTIDGTVTQPAALRTWQTANVQGVADCVFVGSGPGVHCIIKASWKNLYDDYGAPALSNAFNTMQPMMMLFGIDADRGGIQLMQVDETAQDSLGRNDDEPRPRPSDGCRPDDRTCVKFIRESDCSAALTHCWNRIYVTAKPESPRVLMTFMIPPGRLELRLSRVIQGVVPEPKKSR